MSRYIRLDKLIIFFILILHLSLIHFNSLPPVVNAQGLGFMVVCEDRETYIALFDMCMNFGNAVGTTVTLALVIGTLIGAIKLSLGAAQFMFSSGDPQKLQNARDTLTDAALGLILLLSAWVVVGYLEATLPDSWDIDFFMIDFELL